MPWPPPPLLRLPLRRHSPFRRRVGPGPRSIPTRTGCSDRRSAVGDCPGLRGWVAANISWAARALRRKERIGGRRGTQSRRGTRSPSQGEISLLSPARPLRPRGGAPSARRSGRLRQEVAGLLVGREQPLDPPAQGGVAAAGAVQVGEPPRRVASSSAARNIERSFMVGPSIRSAECRAESRHRFFRIVNRLGAAANVPSPLPSSTLAERAPEFLVGLRRNERRSLRAHEPSTGAVPGW